MKDPCYPETHYFLLPCFSSSKQHCPVIQLSCLDAADSMFVLVGGSVSATHVLRCPNRPSWWTTGGTCFPSANGYFRSFCPVIVTNCNWEYGMGNKMI